MNDIEVCILSGGLGTRLQEILLGKPKVIAHIAGRPVITYIFDQLISDGFNQVCLLTGFKSNYIKKTIGGSYKSLKIIYSEEKEPLGTGGAVKLFAEKCNKDNLLLLNGDTLVNLSRKDFINKIPIGFDAILSLQVSNIARYGKLIHDKDFNVTSILEKTNINEPGLINSGTYLIKRKDILKFPKNKFSIEKDYIPLLINSKGIKTVVFKASFLDIGVPIDFYKADDFIKKYF